MKSAVVSIAGFLLAISQYNLIAQTIDTQSSYPVAASLVPEGVPSVPLALAEKAAPYTQSRDAHFQAWAPQGRRLLIRTRFADVPGIHLVSSPLGSREQLTFLREPSRNALWQPEHGRYFIYMSDTGGAEYYQLYRQDFSTGTRELITDGKSRNMYPVFSHDGKYLAYVSTQRNGVDLDLWIVDPEHPTTARMVTEWHGGGLQVFDWSPDGKTIVVLEYVSINQSHLFVVDVATGKAQRIAPSEAGQKISWRNPKFSADGKAILATADKDSEFQRLWSLPLSGGSPVCLTPDVKHDIESFDLSQDDRYLAYEENYEGISRLHLQDFKQSKELAVPKIPLGEISDLHFRPQGTELAFSLSLPTRPFDVYSLSPGDAELTRWTKSETGGLNLENEKETELIHWKAKDGLTISGFLFAPPVQFKGKRPVVIDIHGGPEGQARPQFLGEYHYLLQEMGIAVIYPNVRGSSGFGKTYVSLDNGVKREDSITDIGALLDWIATRPDLDSSRVLIAGMSYGGFMTLASATHYNSRIVGSIDTVGLSNIVTFLEHTSSYRRDLRRVEYGDERDPATRKVLEDIAPANNAAKITKPLFILAGQMDPRVPYSESQQMAQAVRKNQAPVWFLGMKDEGHVFQKKTNIDYAFYLKILFLQKYLFGEDLSHP